MVKAKQDVTVQELGRCRGVKRKPGRVMMTSRLRHGMEAGALEDAAGLWPRARHRSSR
jgi:hypothetical protein